MLINSVVAQITSPAAHIVVVSDPNGNHDSGYAPSNVEDTLAGTSTPPGSPRQASSGTDTAGGDNNVPVRGSGVPAKIKSNISKRNGVEGSPKKEPLR